MRINELNEMDKSQKGPQGVAEGSDKLQGTPVVSLSDFGDKDNTKDKYGRTVPKKLKKDDPRVRFHKEPKKQGVAEAHPNSKIYDKCWDGYKKVPGKKRGEKGSCVKESKSALAEAIQSVDEERTGTFSAVMIHETTPEAAKLILQNGFKPSFNGIFFNVHGQNYSGGGYGGVSIKAKITGPAEDILDLENDEDLPEDLDELADGEEIADYARSQGYWAWTDGVQFAVLDPKHIQVQGINEGMRSVREGEPGIKRVTRKRVDDSTEVRYHVVDSDGVTRKTFDDLKFAKEWLSAHRFELSKD